MLIKKTQKKCIKNEFGSRLYFNCNIFWLMVGESRCQDDCNSFCTTFPFLLCYNVRNRVHACRSPKKEVFYLCSIIKSQTTFPQEVIATKIMTKVNKLF